MNSLQESHLEDERRLRVQADGEGVAIARVQSELGNQAAHHELQVREGGDGSSNRGGEVEERRVGAEQEILGRAQIIIIQPSQKYSEQETVQSPPTPPPHIVVCTIPHVQQAKVLMLMRSGTLDMCTMHYVS